MLRQSFVLICAVSVLGWAVPAQAGCPTCDEITAKGEGFCSKCGSGTAYGVKFKSQKLHDALAGKQVDAEKLTCPGCKAAAENQGYCTACKVGIADGKMYNSKVSYRLAKGEPVKAESIQCPGCVKAAKDNGYCKHCEVGFTAQRVYKNQEDYKAATAAHETLVKAAEAVQKCEGCSVAMVTDGTCEACKVSFTDGRVSGH